MTARQALNKIDSISYYQNRYLKNGSLNLCDSILKSENFTDSQKSEVLLIKVKIESIKDPCLWNEKPNHSGQTEILDKLIDISRIIS